MAVAPKSSGRAASAVGVPIAFSARWLAMMAIIVFFLLHLLKLNAPPNGFYQGREALTSMVAKNFYEHGSPLWKPVVDFPGDGRGITGMELPLFSYVAALFYHVFGLHHWVAHLLVVLGSCAGLWFFFKIMVRTSDGLTAACATWALAFSPLFFFYGYKIMPDMWSLSIWLLSVYLFLRWADESSVLSLGVSALCMGVAVAMMPPYVVSYVPLLVVVVRRRHWKPKPLLALIAHFVTGAGLGLAWLLYAHWLSDLYRSGVFEMNLFFHGWFSSSAGSEFLQRLLVQWPLELWMGWALVPASVYGLLKLIQGRHLPFHIWMILAAYAAFVFYPLNTSPNDYVTLIIVAPVAALTGLGLSSLATGQRFSQALAILLMVLAPITAYMRIAHRIVESDIHAYETLRERTGSVIAPTSLVVVVDETPPARLYQLARRGWSLEEEPSYGGLRDLIARGADYLVLNRPVTPDDSLTTLLSGRSTHLGPVFVYRLADTN